MLFEVRYVYPQSMFSAKIRFFFHLKIIIYGIKNRYILHRHVFVMLALCVSSVHYVNTPML